MPTENNEIDPQEKKTELGKMQKFRIGIKSIPGPGVFGSTIKEYRNDIGILIVLLVSCLWGLYAFVTKERIPLYIAIILFQPPLFYFIKIIFAQDDTTHKS